MILTNLKKIIKTFISQALNEQSCSRTKTSDNLSSLFEIDQAETETESKLTIKESLNPTTDNQPTSILAFEVTK